MCKDPPARICSRAASLWRSLDRRTLSGRCLGTSLQSASARCMQIGSAKVHLKLFLICSATFARIGGKCCGQLVRGFAGRRICTENKLLEGIPCFHVGNACFAIRSSLRHDMEASEHTPTPPSAALTIFSNLLKDKIVLSGASAQDEQDTHTHISLQCSPETKKETFGQSCA